MVTGVPRSLSGDENETPPDYPSPPTPASAAQPSCVNPDSSPNNDGGGAGICVCGCVCVYITQDLKHDKGNPIK